MGLSAWTGAWVSDRLGVRLDGVHDLAGLALRRNPRRAHLLVSPVLGKHVPVDPHVSLAVAADLGRRAAALLDDPAGALVIGYAETATALGHEVARTLGAPYLHSTRRPARGPQLLRFAEEHSHATEHRLLPRDPAVLTRAGSVVLVDDELSTGRTALNTVRALHAVHPTGHYVVAALIDLRGEADRRAVDDLAAELATRIDVVALGTGRVELGADVTTRAALLLDSLPAAAPAPTPRAVVRRVAGRWPSGLPEGGRHGYDPADEPAFARAVEVLATDLATGLAGRARVHVLGTEELMYLPLRLAAGLADLLPGAALTFSSTTRSPVAPVDDPGYPIRSALSFPDHDDPEDGPGDRFAYNLLGHGFDAVVVVLDASADTDRAAGLVHALAGACDEVVVLTVPEAGQGPVPLHGPAFGSYAADDVSWLLTDLSHVELEAPTEEREDAIQAGRAHYAESLPIEFEPSPAYYALFEQALAETAARLALAVGVVTELVLQTRGDDVVLASLARAGTPVGILVRRWAREAHGLDLAHHALSIVRGRGIDAVALTHLAARHPTERVVFVDGWTGKGAIARELTASLAAHNAAHGTAFDDRLVVLADTGHCVETFGTRDDFLIASACLNSTVSGLVSRTVLNDALIGPGDFHGAKFYAHLAGADRSRHFLDSVSAHFAEVGEQARAEADRLLASDRTPTWSGWAAIEEIRRTHGLDSPHLVKPGVGETTRVLLRRVPWKVLVRPGAQDGLAHVLDLAAQRGVEVEEVPGLAYSCVGLIRPREGDA